MTKEQLAKFGITIDKDEVSDEEAHKLIEAKISGLDADRKKLKGLNDKYSTEIADYKKKETDRLSEEEKKTLYYQELEKENASLKKAKAIGERENSYIGLGYDPALAKQIAEAEVEGKPTAELHKKHMTALEQKVKAEVLKNGDTPKVDDKTKTWTKESFAEASYEEKLKLHEENPALFEELTK